ncbi:MAG: 50S ribosomal protein L7ae [Candidatus Diapherotrites archaeon CG09_land_8_20_14_0_10_32_12]|nr:MAG: 50S ribosomal protein L7ae [Candidatus Diapherotrites archaeon CG09_land_8_20_14_0_10_32_12]
MPQFVKFETPQETYDKIKALLSKVSRGGKIKAGVNEVTKVIERGMAKFVVMAEDVSPEELLMHIPVLCKEKKVSYGYLPTKKDLGEASGLKISASCIAITDDGTLTKDVEQLKTQLLELVK